MSIDMGSGFWFFGLFGFLIVLLFWGLVIAAIVLGIRWLIQADQRGRIPPSAPPSSPAVDALDVLRQRYARGEIDDEEFERRKRTLGG